MSTPKPALSRIRTIPTMTIALTTLLVGAGAVCLTATGNAGSALTDPIPPRSNPPTAATEPIAQPLSPVIGEVSDADARGPLDEIDEGDDVGLESDPPIDVLPEAWKFEGSEPTAAAWSVLDLQPIGPQASPSVCDVGNGQPISVEPSAITLPAAASTFELAVTYCGSEASTITPSTGPGLVGNWKQAGIFEPTQTQTVTVQVHRDVFPVGGFATQIGFTDGHGAETTVPVTGMSFGPFGAAQISTSLTAGGAAPGCSAACITSAELSPGVGVADVALDVETNTTATLSVALFDQPPMYLNGQPVVGGAMLHATSPTPTTSWTISLDPLAHDTTYYLVVEATDAQHRSARVAHSFTTMAPAAAGYSGNDPEPGCAAQCVTEAQLQATDSFSSVGLHVETHTPAKIVAQVGTSVTWQDGWPIVSGAVTDATFDQYATSWDATFDGLSAETDYVVVVRATDDNGKTDVRAGEFRTATAPPVDVLVRFEKLVVRWDADSSPINRGELRFAWGIDDVRLGSRAEAKHLGGDQIVLESDTNGWVVPFIGDEARLFTLAGGERDPLGIGFVCEAVSGTTGVPAWRAQDRHDCDNVKWNAAPMLMTFDEINGLPWCSDYGIGGPAGNRKCHDVDTPNFGDDVPRFTAIVSFDVMD